MTVMYSAGTGFGVRHAAVTSITLSERGDMMEMENGIHFGGAAKVQEGAVHPCRGDGHRNQRRHHKHLYRRDT
jgi:hypothetical protein